MCLPSGLFILASFSLLMCQNAEELRKMANWAGVKGGSREHLMDNICGKNFSLPCNTTIQNKLFEISCLTL